MDAMIYLQNNHKENTKREGSGKARMNLQGITEKHAGVCVQNTFYEVLRELIKYFF